MTTIKSYTDLEQSKKLAEILPIESADMRYGYIAPYDYSDRMYDGGCDEIPYQKDFLIKNPNFSANEYDAELPCWSLAALFSALPKSARLEMGKATELYRVSLPVELEASDWYINPVDACYEMIIKLHEQKLL